MIESSHHKNKRIVKNTLFMYGRMLVFLIISLFTSRIVLNTLGFDNFGIWNLVGSVIVFFTFLNNGLGMATRRFITAELSTSDLKKVNIVFNGCMHAHFIIAILIILLAETIGIYIVNYVLNIPSDRLYAANITFQVCILMAILGIIQSPYSTLMVAHENMSVFAAFTILDVILKLLIIYLVQAIPGDKLLVFTWLSLGVSIISMLGYRIYTYRTYPECRRLTLKVDKSLLKKIFGFTSWSLAGQTAVVGTNQGITVLINLYYGVIVNAAMGVSNSVTNIVQGFVSNFQTAFNPQIIKSYTSKEYDYLFSLMIRGAKLSSFLILFFTIPIIFEIKDFLILWLNDYPEYTPQFCVLVLIANYLDAIAAPLYMVVYAQSDIKRYQIAVSLVYSLNFFLGWIFLALGFLPYWVIIVRIIVYIALLFVRMYYVKRMLPEFKLFSWFNSVVGSGILIASISAIMTGATVYFIPDLSILLTLLIVCMVSVLTSGIAIWFVGLDYIERKYLKRFIQQKTQNLILIFKHR